MSESIKLVQGNTYRAKRPRNAGGFFNDRTVIYVGATHVQYDGPSVGFGQHYPSVAIDKFITWCGCDITDELPDGEYQEWGTK